MKKVIEQQQKNDNRKMESVWGAVAQMWLCEGRAPQADGTVRAKAV